MTWIKQNKRNDPGEDDFSWDLHNPEISLRVFKMLESIEWRVLPYSGGLMDQPDWLMEDLMVISWVKRNLEEKVKPIPEGVTKGQIRNTMDG